MKKHVVQGAILIIISALTTGSLFAQSAGTVEENDEVRVRAKTEVMREREKMMHEKEKHLQEALEQSKYINAADFDFDFDFDMPGDGRFIVFSDSKAGSSSQLSLSKSFDGESKETDGSFDVDKSSKSISITISGSATNGSINVNLYRPDGKEQGNLTIDASADVRFTKRIKFGDETKDFFGEWKYKVAAKDAKGYYKLSISTN